MIGVFDSGAGGLCALSHLLRLRPHGAFCYYADTAALPFGEKSPAFIRERISRALAFFESAGADGVLFACGTASSYLEWKEPFPFPVFDIITPAACAAKDFARVGLICTRASAACGRFARTLAQKTHCTVLSLPCPSLVTLAESGRRAKKKELSRALAPIAVASPDALVLGCTHFSLLAPQIARVLPHTPLIDAAACAAENAMQGIPPKDEPPSLRFAVTGELPAFQKTACRVLGKELPKEAFFNI